MALRNPLIGSDLGVKVLDLALIVKSIKDQYSPDHVRTYLGSLNDSNYRFSDTMVASIRSGLYEQLDYSEMFASQAGFDREMFGSDPDYRLFVNAGLVVYDKKNGNNPPIELENNPQ